MARSSYTVIYKRGDRPNQWLAFVKEVEGCHTFGRGLKQTRERVREALELWEGASAKKAKIKEVLPVPKGVQTRLQTLQKLRKELEKLEEQRLNTLVSVVSELDGWSARDLGSVLGVSYQRVSQVKTAARPRRAKRRKVPLSRR